MKPLSVSLTHMPVQKLTDASMGCLASHPSLILLAIVSSIFLPATIYAYVIPFMLINQNSYVRKRCLSPPTSYVFLNHLLEERLTVGILFWVTIYVLFISVICPGFGKAVNTEETEAHFCDLVEKGEGGQKGKCHTPCPKSSAGQDSGPQAI